MKKTKILATLGPASEKKPTIKKMVTAGVNLFRLNFSHGDYENHKMLIRNVRAVEKELRVKLGIMADIQGPRIRIANKKPLKLKEGEKVFVTDQRSAHNHGYKKELQFDWDKFYVHLKTGKRIFIEDGLIQLEITRRMNEGAAAKVLMDCEIKPHKGVNIPSISRHMGFLTEKDMQDLEFVLSQNVDFVAASFVGDGDDLRNLKKIMGHILQKHKIDNFPWIVPKIERSDAVKNLDDVLHESDAALIARGDLAIEEPQEKVNIYQKNIIKTCRKVHKPVIVATQMMASMENSIRPTRAEISDVTNAVIDNTDAVMLSGESAMGKYPVETIETMAKIIHETEESVYNDMSLKKNNKFGRLFAKLAGVDKKGKKRGRKKVVKASNLADLIGFACLRQEDVRLSLNSRSIYDKRKASLVWGAK